MGLKRFLACFLYLTWTVTVMAQGRFRPGDIVPEPYLKVYGYEKFFTISKINGEVRALMLQNSYKDEAAVVPMESLRYLRVLHCDEDGNAVVGELVCAASIARDLEEIMKALFEAGYPIEKMRLVDYYGGDDEASMRDNNTSCFNQRLSTSGAKVSRHSYGLAIDINPLYNPYYKAKAFGKIVRPAGSDLYLNRKAHFPYKIQKGDLCYRLFKEHGFRWGGEWLSGKDYQHFEKH